MSIEKLIAFIAFVCIFYTLNIICIFIFSFVLIALTLPKNSQQKFANSVNSKDYFPYYLLLDDYCYFLMSGSSSSSTHRFFTRIAAPEPDIAPAPAPGRRRGLRPLAADEGGDGAWRSARQSTGCDRCSRGASKATELPTCWRSFIHGPITVITQ